MAQCKLIELRQSVYWRVVINGVLIRSTRITIRFVCRVWLNRYALIADTKATTSHLMIEFTEFRLLLSRGSGSSNSFCELVMKPLWVTAPLYVQQPGISLFANQISPRYEPNTFPDNKRTNDLSKWFHRYKSQPWSRSQRTPKIQFTDRSFDTHTNMRGVFLNRMRWTRNWANLINQTLTAKIIATFLKIS